MYVHKTGVSRFIIEKYWTKSQSELKIKSAKYYYFASFYVLSPDPVSVVKSGKLNFGSCDNARLPKMPSFLIHYGGY